MIPKTAQNVKGEDLIECDIILDTGRYPSTGGLFSICLKDSTVFPQINTGLSLYPYGWIGFENKGWEAEIKKKISGQSINKNSWWIKVGNLKNEQVLSNGRNKYN